MQQPRRVGASLRLRNLTLRRLRRAVIVANMAPNAGAGVRRQRRFGPCAVFREKRMKIDKALYLGVAALSSVFAVAPAPSQAQQSAVVIDNDDIGGVVTGPKGPEAGVWVIAETV